MSDIFDEPVATERSKLFPLYPHLSEHGRIEAERVIEHAKKRLKAVCEEALGEIYIDIPSHIESDSWMNFRNDLMDGFRNYKNEKIQGKYDFKEIRAQIFKEFRKEILADLNQDNLEKIKELEERIAHLIEMQRYRG